MFLTALAAARLHLEAEKQARQSATDALLWILDHAIAAWLEQGAQFRDYADFVRDHFRCTAPGCTARRNLQAHPFSSDPRAAPTSRGIAPRSARSITCGPFTPAPCAAAGARRRGTSSSWACARQGRRCCASELGTCCSRREAGRSPRGADGVEDGSCGRPHGGVPPPRAECWPALRRGMRLAYAGCSPATPLRSANARERPARGERIEDAVDAAEGARPRSLVASKGAPFRTVEDVVGRRGER